MQAVTTSPSKNHLYQDTGSAHFSSSHNNFFAAFSRSGDSQPNWTRFCMVLTLLLEEKGLKSFSLSSMELSRINCAKGLVGKPETGEKLHLAGTGHNLPLLCQ